MSFEYKVRVDEREAQVCALAFQSIYGINRGRVRYIQAHIVKYGTSPKGSRGRHQNRARKTDDQVLEAIKQHIQSFPARQSHYSRRDNPRRMYLPEDFSVRTMHKMFLEKGENSVSYLVYWKVFNSSFNLKFGLPRSDTCAICDKYKHDIEATPDEEEKNNLRTQHQLHLAKAETFYALKRKNKSRCRGGPGVV